MLLLVLEKAGGGKQMEDPAELKLTFRKKKGIKIYI